MKAGDVINEINGIPLKDEDLEKIASHVPGAKDSFQKSTTRFALERMVV